MTRQQEDEIQARIEFKMNELLTSVENAAKANWFTAFRGNSQKHSHYWEAFGQMKQMLIKEMQMDTPYDDMAEQKRRDTRNQAVQKIMDRLCRRGVGDYYPNARFVAEIIENIQNQNL